MPSTALTTRTKKDKPVSVIAGTTDETEARPNTLRAHPTGKEGPTMGYTQLSVLRNQRWK